jgi:hypothetical protein
MIVVIYFGVMRLDRATGTTLLLSCLALLIWTTPNRWGAAVALHYLSRVYWPEPADSIPPPRRPDPATTSSAEATNKSSGPP